MFLFNSNSFWCQSVILSFFPACWFSQQLIVTQERRMLCLRWFNKSIIIYHRTQEQFLSSSLWRCPALYRHSKSTAFSSVSSFVQKEENVCLPWINKNNLHNKKLTIYKSNKNRDFRAACLAKYCVKRECKGFFCDEVCECCFLSPTSLLLPVYKLWAASNCLLCEFPHSRIRTAVSLMSLKVYVFLTTT